MVSGENDFVLINACKKIRSSIIAGYPIEQKRALDFSEAEHKTDYSKNSKSLVPLPENFNIWILSNKVEFLTIRS
jgi:hypothetical protein